MKEKKKTKVQRNRRWVTMLPENQAVLGEGKTSRGRRMGSFA
jgi:hypothetical protein